MGQKTGIGEISLMRSRRFLATLGVSAWLFCSPGARAEGESSKITLEATHASSTDHLSTEKVWILDPEESNPHRQRWLIHRDVQLRGLVARPDASGSTFGVTARGLRAHATLYFRPNGPWYRPIQEFPCEEKLTSQYANREGTEKAAEVAVHEWERILSEEKSVLETMLSKVQSNDRTKVVLIAERFFHDWLSEVTLRWQNEGKTLAREKEWNHYREVTKKAGSCTKNSLIPWERLMEGPAEGNSGIAGRPIDEMKVLARAPLKWVEGLPTIRLNLRALGRKLNGRFLVHTGVEHSAISPDFLIGQGVAPAWLELENVAPRRVSWGGSPESPRGGLGRVVRLDQVELGNHLTTFHDFTLFDTELFSVPQVTAPCCDGVLGSDFLRSHVVELISKPSPEMKFWPAEEFHLDPEMHAHWMEVFTAPSGELVSSCVLKGDRTETLAGLELFGASWDTSVAENIAIHLPLQKEVFASLRESAPDSLGWKLNCQFPDQVLVAEGSGISLPPLRDTSTKTLQSRTPAFSLGSGFFKKHRVFFDLPHGRIWLAPGKATSPRGLRNSGLRVHFDLKPNQSGRRLRVDSIQVGSPAQSLALKGLKKGSVILEIDGLSVEDLNQWDVVERLSGSQGSEIRVVWAIPRGKQAATLKLSNQ